MAAPIVRLVQPVASALLALSLPVPAQIADERAQAREPSKEGAVLFKAGNFAAAVKKFEAATALVPHPVLDIDIGRCYEKLDDSPGAPDNVREAARECVDRATSVIGPRPVLRVMSRPKGASVLVDGQHLTRGLALVPIEDPNAALRARWPGWAMVGGSVAAFREFDPFWEFVAGPLDAGTFGPNPLDPTFGPEATFGGMPRDLQPDRSPLDGFQFFGIGSIDPKTRPLTMRLHDAQGAVVHGLELGPR